MHISKLEILINCLINQYDEIIKTLNLSYAVYSEVHDQNGPYQYDSLNKMFVLSTSEKLVFHFPSLFELLLHSSTVKTAIFISHL